MLRLIIHTASETEITIENTPSSASPKQLCNKIIGETVIKKLNQVIEFIIYSVSKMLFILSNLYLRHSEFLRNQ